MDDRFDAIVVGAGPAGIAAAREMAEAGLSVVVLERGQYPGAKNVSGGILYRQPTEEIIPGFESEAPLERPIIEQRYLALTGDAMLGGIYRSQDFASPPYNSYSVLRSEFDRWYVQGGRSRRRGLSRVHRYRPPVRKGKVIGVSTGEPDGELLAHVVVLADGANSLLAKQADMHVEWDPIDQALVAKELIALPPGTIEDRFQLPTGLGAAYEIFGESTWNHLGYGFIYTNKASLSIGTGALLQDLIESGHNVNDMLDRFKKHPAIAPLIAGGETIEYSAHLIPEFGYKKLPRLFADGVLVVGDAAGLVNPINREGANLAMISGKLAGQTVRLARERDDSSIATLSRYRELLDASIVLKDLHKVRNATHFAHERPHLLVDYPELISTIAKTYLTVDGKSKKEKMAEISRLLRGLPARRTIGDALGGFRSMMR
ncbi:MAG: FAD-dependent oxidoreductase [Thermomicrobiales bacterium]